MRLDCSKHFMDMIDVILAILHDQLGQNHLFEILAYEYVINPLGTPVFKLVAISINKFIPVKNYLPFIQDQIREGELLACNRIL